MYFLVQNYDRMSGGEKTINDNLEAMAKQLYDYWFVQFDFPNEEGKPYKASGGAMVWNERLKREIPIGWTCCSIKEMCDINKKTINKDEHKQIEYLDTGSITQGHISNTEIYNVDMAPSRAQRKVEDLSILYSSVRPRLLHYGILSKPKENFIVSTGFVTLDAKCKKMALMVYYFLTSNTITEHLASIADTAVSSYPSISPDDIAYLDIVIPSNDIIQKYNDIVEPMFRKMSTLRKEIDSLTKQRDELLPLLMNGQASVNYHLSASFLSSFILYRDQYKLYDMKETVIQAILDGMRAILTDSQLELLTDMTRRALSECEITPKLAEEEQRNKENAELLGAFISSKKVEGCSDKTIHYYKSSIEKLIATVKKNVCDIATNDIRCYLAEQQEQRGLSKVTIDNLRRIYSSFFSWLEDEDYITKSPVRRIHKVRTDALVKEVLTDENIEVLRDSCQELRDIAMIDLLLSTGMRVGELVKINREDIDFQERQCVVFGKGNKEREVYFNARTKIHLKKYLEQRTDSNPALFVSLHEPHTRLTISGVEVRLRQLGKRVNLNKVHPHKFRRTLATMAIDKGMPIEQVQKMLGHVKIDTTLHYAMVNQANVKIAHRKFLN